MATIEKLGVKRYRVFLSKSVDGKRTRKCYTLNGTRKEVEEEVVRLEHEFYREVGVTDNHNIMFYQFAHIWFKDYGDHHLKAKSSRTYKDLLNKYVIPTLGKRNIKSIKATHILALYSKLRTVEKNDKGDLLSPTTITHIHSIIHKILSDAVRWQYISDNPADRVTKPKREKPKPNYYDRSQINQLLIELDQLEPEKYKWKLGCYIALTAGLRLAEIAGLKWNDIDFENNIIHIKRTRKYVSKVGVIVESPKTDTSFRTVSMPDILKRMFIEYHEYLQEQETICGDLWAYSDYVLVDMFGREVFPDSLSKWFSRFVKSKELPKMSFHGLRHTMATLLIHDPTVPERTISDRLGHANTNTLRKIYSHELKDSDKLAADSIDNIFRNNGQKH